MARLKAPQRREQLISVATKQFAKFGYDATTTDTIAKSAGVTEPILYRHFGSKQELFIAITREVSDQTLRHWRELIGPIDDPAEQLREIARQFPEHLKEMGDAYRVIHNALTTSRDRKVLTRAARALSSDGNILLHGDRNWNQTWRVPQGGSENTVLESDQHRAGLRDGDAETCLRLKPLM